MPDDPRAPEATADGAPLGEPLVAPLGERAVLVRLGTRLDPLLAGRARRLADRLRAAPLPGLRSVVPAAAAVVVHFDARVADPAAVLDAVRACLTTEDAAAPAADAPRLHVLPVRYDGPDLAEVAAAAGLSTEEVVARHAAPTYTVLAVGFVPGFGYLGLLDERLRLPRRDAPRPRVPPGSVAIAGAQTAVYPFATPGGWHLIGRTDVPLFDPAAAAPARLQVGDRVRFAPARA